MSRSAQRPWALLGLLVLTTLRWLIASPLIDATALWASGRFVYPAQQLLRGAALYRDVWGHVPPLITVVDALGWAVGGLWGLWLVELVVLLAAVVVCYRLLERTFGGTAAFFGTACALLGLSLLLQGNQIEEYALLLQFGALYAFRRAEARIKPSAWSFATGALLGLLFWLRPDLVGVGLAMGLYLLSQIVRRRSAHADARLMTLIIGALTVVFVGAALLAVGGVLGEAWSAVIRYNLAVTVPLDDRFGAILNGLQTLMRAGLPLVAVTAWAAGVKMALTPSGFSLTPAPSPGGRGVKQMPRDASDGTLDDSQPPHTPLLLVALIALPIELVVTLLDGSQAVNHVLPWLPSTAILAASLASLLVNAKRSETIPADSADSTDDGAVSTLPGDEARELREIPARVWLGAVLVALSLMPLVDAANAFHAARTQNDGANAVRLQAIDGLRQVTQPDERVLVWGDAPMVNVLADRRSGARVFEQMPLFVPVDPMQAPFAALAQDIMNRPDYVLDTASGGDRVPPLDPQRRRVWQLNQQAGFLPAVTITPELQLVFETVSQYYRPLERYGAWTLYARNDLQTGTTSR